MNRYKGVLTFFFLFYCFTRVSAQSDSTIFFKNYITGEPINGVKIINRNNIQITQSNNSGFATIPGNAFADKGYIIAFCSGYEPDTVRKFSKNVYLYPLSIALPIAIINGRKTHKLLKSSMEYVLDYDFIDSSIIALTYSNSSNAKLFLLDGEGNARIVKKIPHGAISIFKSCVGNYYCTYIDRFYKIVIDSNKIYLQDPRSISLLSELQKCELSLDSNLYYRTGNKTDFTMVYSLLMKKDTALKTFFYFNKHQIADASEDDLFEILALLGGHYFNEAAKVQHVKTLLDNSSYSHLDIPIFNIGDTVIIFDYYKKRILYFNNSGLQLGFMPIHFDWNSSQLQKIIKDNELNRFYILSKQNQQLTSLQEFDVQTGNIIGSKIFIEKAGATKINVHNGDIFYLWQDEFNAQTMQLFKQTI